MIPVRRQLLVAALAAASVAVPSFAQPPSYPSRPITLVVAYPPGGDTDSCARLFAEKLTARLNQKVIVENRPGAGGTIGNALVGRAAPDGYTLLFTPNPFTTAPMVLNLSPASSYDVLHGFEPVIKTATQPLLLVASPGTGLTSVADLIASSKTGRTLTYATPGAGSPMHVLGEWLNRSAGVRISHVPYRGVGPAVTDVVAGHVDTAWVTIGAVAQYLALNKVVPLAVGEARRTPLASNVPTLAEAGYKDVVVGAWQGIFAPKGTPPEVIRLLNAHMNEILKMPDVVERLATYGALPAGGAPEVLGRTNATEYETMSRLIRDLNIRAD